jgi:RND family efflux transporter MFP subunit
MRRLAHVAAVWAVASLLPGCGGAPRTGGAAASAEALAVVTVTVTAQSRPLERRLDGVIEAVNQGTVAAQTSGRVAEILYDVNDFVPAGAVIMRLRSTEQRAGLEQAQAALSEASARDAEAQVRYQRIADMYQRKVVPRATLDAATADRDAAAARLSAARATVESAREGVAYTEVRAPYAGVVTKRLVQVGETVSPGTPLMSGLSLQYLRVEVDIPQSIVDQVRRVKQAAVYVAGRRIAATRVTVFPEASTPSSTFRTRLDLPENATDLYPGMFVKTGFVVGARERLLVPAPALVRRGEVTAVYVVDLHGQISLRQVRVGDRFDDSVEVLSGLSAGEHVALDPQAAFKALTSFDSASGSGM